MPPGPEGDRAAAAGVDGELPRDVPYATSRRKLAAKGWKPAPVVSD